MQRVRICIMAHHHIENLRAVGLALRPDLFGEGQGAVASGELDALGVLQASEVLAKHDENYMPPEVADALEKSGFDHQGNAK